MKKIIIIGSGPAGLTAAIYLARANFSPIVIEGDTPGGQLIWTSVVENYPGFENGILGAQLMQSMKKQAERFGASIISESVVSVDFRTKPFKITTKSQNYETEVVVIASGARSRMLGLNREQEFLGKGVHTCATCDGAFYKGKNVIVAGGGDSAMEEANFLSKFADNVCIIHRNNCFTASEIMKQRTENNPKIKVIFNAQIKEYFGDNKITGVKLINNQTNQETEMLIDGIFMAIGHIPNTEIFQNQLKLGKMNYIEPVNNVFTEIPGIFVAGDIADWRYKQAITAAGFGCMAALEAEKYFENIHAKQMD